MSEDLTRILELLECPPCPGALATLVAIEGSSYRRPGARLLWLEDGRRAGSISGGCIEADLLEHARAVTASGSARHVAYNTDSDGDPVWGVGTGCDGRLDIVVEPILPIWESLRHLPSLWERGVPVLARIAWSRGQADDMRTEIMAGAGEATPAGRQVFTQSLEAPPELWLFGAGDDARPLASLARELGFRIHCFDTRSGLLSLERFPGAVLHPVSPGLPPRFPIRRGRACAVVMSHRFLDDVETLAALANQELAYLGVLGARRRTGRLAATLESRLGADAANRLFATARAPVGLDLGGDGPAAIALSILSEIQAILHDAEGTPLSHCEKPIHPERSGRALGFAQGGQGGGRIGVPG